MVICDIDHTVANDDERSILATGKKNPKRELTPKEMEIFYKPELALADPVVEMAKECLDRLREMGEEIYMVSGRHECRRLITEAWFEKNEIPYDRIFLRPDNFRVLEFKTFVICELMATIDDKNWFCIDDDERVLEVYKASGATDVIHAPEGWKDLWEAL